MAKKPLQKQEIWTTIVLGSKEEYSLFDHFDISGPLRDVITKLNSWDAQATALGFTDVSLEISHEEGYYGCDGLKIRLNGKRYETDAEFEKRVKEMEQARKDKKERQRKAEETAYKMYQKLEKRFGKR